MLISEFLGLARSCGKSVPGSFAETARCSEENSKHVKKNLLVPASTAMFGHHLVILFLPGEGEKSVKMSATRLGHIGKGPDGLDKTLHCAANTSTEETRRLHDASVTWSRNQSVALCLVVSVFREKIHEICPGHACSVRV